MAVKRYAEILKAIGLQFTNARYSGLSNFKVKIMKTKNMIIVLLILALVAKTFFLIGELYKEKTYKQYQKPDVYIMDLTKKIHQLYDCIAKKDSQLGWYNRHLNNMVMLVERKEQLPEIECKTTAGDVPSRKIKLEMNLPFYESYTVVDYNSVEKTESEFTVDMLTASLNMKLNNWKWQANNMDDLISCYEKRIEQIGKYFELDNEEAFK